MDLVTDEVPKTVSSPISLDHLEGIEELGFKDHYILTQRILLLCLWTTNCFILSTTFGRRWVTNERERRVVIK